METVHALREIIAQHKHQFQNHALLVNIAVQLDCQLLLDYVLRVITVKKTLQ